MDYLAPFLARIGDPPTLSRKQMEEVTEVGGLHGAYHRNTIQSNSSVKKFHNNYSHRRTSSAVRHPSAPRIISPIMCYRTACETYEVGWWRWQTSSRLGLSTRRRSYSGNRHGTRPARGTSPRRTRRSTSATATMPCSGYTSLSRG